MKVIEVIKEKMKKSLKQVHKNTYSVRKKRNPLEKSQKTKQTVEESGLKTVQELKVKIESIMETAGKLELEF